MRNETRLAFNAYLQTIAQLNGVESAAALDEGWSAGGDEEELPDLSAQTPPEEEVDLDHVADPQLDRACDMLKGILVFQKR